MNVVKRFLPPLLFGAALVCAWQLKLLHRLFHITQMQLPLPSRILAAFFSHLPRIGADAVTTVGPALLGLLLGAALGYGVALIVTARPVGAHGLLILVTVVNAIPIIALAPMVHSAVCYQARCDSGRCLRLYGGARIAWAGRRGYSAAGSDAIICGLPG